MSAHDHPNRPDPGFTRIEPVAIDLTAHRTTTTPAPRRFSLRQALPWLGLATLLVAATLVIFLLPGWVAAPSEAPGAAPGVTAVATPNQSSDPSSSLSPPPVTNGRPAPAPSPAAVSPWEQAQESKLRRDTQETLEKILSAQKLLVERGVSAWAAEEYAQSLQLAEAGDERYNQRDFAGARGQYQQALGILQLLQERVDTVFSEAITAGDQALAAGDSTAAAAAFDLALAIDAADRTALRGRDRAASLDEVMALLRQGDRLLADDQLEEALQPYRQALELDEDTARAADQIRTVEQKIQQQVFSRRMSAGFNALYDGRPERAEQEFTAALKLQPSSAEAREALGQSRRQLTARSIDTLIAQAQAFEAEERWREALEQYAAALKLEPGLAPARAGQERAEVRAQMHQKLEQILAQPERLYDAGVLAETNAFHRAVRAVAEPGPRLSAQLVALAQLLDKMAVTRAVQLSSDNLTQVTLYKVGELGQFTTREVQLRPGRYVAVGIREGYRDVRVEFTVEPDQPLPAVDIRASERIVFARQGGI